MPRVCLAEYESGYMTWRYPGTYRSMTKTTDLISGYSTACSSGTMHYSSTHILNVTLLPEEFASIKRVMSKRNNKFPHSLSTGRALNEGATHYSTVGPDGCFPILWLHYSTVKQRMHNMIGLHLMFPRVLTSGALQTSPES